MIGFILGIYTASQLPALFSVTFGLSLIAIILSGYALSAFFGRINLQPIDAKGLFTLVLPLYGRTFYRINIKALGCFFLCGAVGFTWFSYVADSQLKQRLTSDHAGEWLVTGSVEGLPEQGLDLLRFNLVVSHIIESPEMVEAQDAKFQRLRLRWFKPDRLVLPGQRLSLRVKLKPPHSLVNPHGFDYERWALVKGIDATGYIKEVVNEEAAQTSLSLVRFALAQWIDKIFIESPLIAASYRALLLGDRGGLTDDDWELMQLTGTSHLLVVSGLHIGICVGLGWWLGRLLVLIGYVLARLIDRVALVPLWAERLVPISTALLLSGMYVALAGFSLPTQRAWIMSAVLLGGLLMKQPPSVWKRWWFAMALVLLLNPLSIYEIGFWLSFGAVGALLLLVHRRSHLSFIKATIYTQLWISAIMLPLVAMFFGQVSLISPAINVFAIPYMLLLLSVSLPALLCAGLGWVSPILWVGSLLAGFWAVLGSAVAYIDRFLGGASFLLMFKPQGWALISLCVGVVLIVQPAIIRLRLIGAFCCLPAFFPERPSIAAGTFSALVFDVGQGNAVLISTQHHRLLYDTGAKYRSGRSVFESAVLPYLSQFELVPSGYLLDALVISHADNDHAGGLQSIIDNNISYGSFMGGSPVNLLAQPLMVKQYEACQQRQSWEWDGVSFRFLVAPSQLTTTNTNNQSCVLEVRSQQCSFLLTGDIDSAVETELVPQLRMVSWLLAGHHGSRYSTGDALLSATAPQTVLFSSGFLSRYGHPHSDVLDRVRPYTNSVFRTDLDGAITLKETADGRCVTESQRAQQKRFWSKS